MFASSPVVEPTDTLGPQWCIIFPGVYHLSHIRSMTTGKLWHLAGSDRQDKNQHFYVFFRDFTLVIFMKFTNTIFWALSVESVICIRKMSTKMKRKKPPKKFKENSKETIDQNAHTHTLENYLYHFNFTIIQFLFLDQEKVLKSCLSCF